MHRNESPMMRHLRQLDYQRQALTTMDKIIIAFVAVVVATMLGIGLMTVLDWIDGVAR